MSCSEWTNGHVIFASKELSAFITFLSLFNYQCKASFILEKLTDRQVSITKVYKCFQKKPAESHIHKQWVPGAPSD